MYGNVECTKYPSQDKINIDKTIIFYRHFVLFHGSGFVYWIETVIWIKEFNP